MPNENAVARCTISRRIFNLLLLLVTIGASAAFAQDGPVINIRDYGAMCDGSDDTRVVQTALNALPPGGTLVFPCIASITRVSLKRASRITIAGQDGGGVSLLTETGDIWATAFSVTYCDSCMIRDLVFEGNFKNIIPFDIEESNDTTVYGLTIRNVNLAGAAFLALHNRGNQYRNNTIQNVGLALNPGLYDTTRGMWIGGVSDDAAETGVSAIGNYFVDIAGTALVAHGTNITVANNRGERLNWACIKVVPLGNNDTLIAGNNCSGAGARWLIGGGIMTEYYNSSYERTVIRDNTLEGYSDSDVDRIPDSPNVGINIANTPDKTSHNVTISNNTIRNTLYDGIQISGPTDNFVIDSNIIERTISPGKQWNGINLQGDSGKQIVNGTIRRNLITGKFDGIHVSANGGVVNALTVENNSVVVIARDGLHLEEQNGGQISSVSLSNPCFSQIARRTVWDNRPKGMQLFSIPVLPGGREETARPKGCSDPRLLQ
jgi:parallel beta-helix repeat protein